MLRRILSVGSMFAAVALLTVSLSWGAEEPKPRVKGEGRAIPSDVLKQLDKNGNGALEPEEKAAALAAREKGGRLAGKPGEGRALNPEIIKKFDKDGDGKLSETEIGAAKAERMKNGAAGGARFKAEMIKKFDKNGDGQLDDAERETARAEFKKNAPAGDRPQKRPEGAPEKKAEPKKPETK